MDTGGDRVREGIEREREGERGREGKRGTELYTVGTERYSGINLYTSGGTGNREIQWYKAVYRWRQGE